MSTNNTAMLRDKTGELIPQWYDSVADVFRPVSDEYPMPHNEALRIGSVTGASISTSGTAAAVAIPLTSASALPKRIRVAASVAACFKLGHGGEAAATASLKFVSGVVGTAGTGHAAGDVLTMAGGTAVTSGKFAVATTKLASVAVNAAGSGYDVADVITTLGGTRTVPATLTVATLKLVSTVINAAGTLYAQGDTITLAGGTSSSPAIITVDTVGVGGDILAFHISTAGSYTVKSASLTEGSTDSIAGSGATFQTSLFGVNTVTISAAGSYTVNSTTFTQSSVAPTGGTGATFNTAVYGVNTVTVNTAGEYTAIPSNDVAQASSTGSGINAAITTTWGLGPATITNAGSDYSSAPVITVSSSGGSGGSYTAVINNGAVASIVAVAGTGYTSVPTLSFPVTVAATVNDTMVQPGSPLIVDTQGYGHISAIQFAAAGVLQVSPIED